MDTSFVILSVSIVGIVATALLLLSYYLFLTRCGLLVLWRSADDSDDRHLSIVVVRERRGLHAADIRRIPTFRYRSDDQKTKSECAVCLADFRPGERLRLLPPCRHAFHIDCIDAWLQATANCPLCRATVLLADAVIEISSEAPQPSRAPAEEEEQPSVMRGRRSLSMDSSTDKRFYLALQRMLHHQQHQEHQQLPPEEEPRSLRRSFFSFSHSRSASILPL